MPEEIQKFDPSTLMQGVKDRIKATFVSLIPDDQWDVMVKKEVDAFFQEQTKRTTSRDDKHSYGSVTTNYNQEWTETMFRSIVWEVCIEKTNATIKKELNDNYFDTVYKDGGYILSDNLQKVMERAIPAAITNFFESIALRYINDFRNQINR